MTLNFDLIMKNLNIGYYFVMVATQRASLSSDNSYLFDSDCFVKIFCQVKDDIVYTFSSPTKFDSDCFVMIFCQVKDVLVYTFSSSTKFNSDCFVEIFCQVEDGFLLLLFFFFILITSLFIKI